MEQLKVDVLEVKVAKKTEVQKVKDKIDHTRELVMAALNWDDLTYGNFVMEKAEEYLKRQCGRDAYGIQALMESALFWKWWKNHWMQRDEAFLYEWVSFEDVDHLRAEYDLLHSAANLHMRPNRVILEDSYAVMIGTYLKGGVQC